MTGSNRTLKGARAGREPRGFALLVAIVLASVAAAVTLALTTLAYKGLLLAASTQQSQFAFYGADAALECALYWDSYHNVAFTYNQSTNAVITCEGTSLTLVPQSGPNGSTEFQSPWFPFANGQGCARITVYKESTGHAELYGDGVTNATCPNSPSSPTITPRSTERGIKAIY